MLPAESHPSRGVLGAAKKIGSNSPPKNLRGELGGHSRTCPVLPRDKSPLDKVHPYLRVGALWVFPPFCRKDRDGAKTGTIDFLSFSSFRPPPGPELFAFLIQ